MSRSADFEAVWRPALVEVASTLNLDDPEDRAALRRHIDHLTRRARLDAINDIAEMLGRTRQRSRSEAVRTVADAIIEEARS